MTGNSGGPWGRGGGSGDNDDRNRPNGNGGDDRRPRNASLTSITESMFSRFTVTITYI